MVLLHLTIFNYTVIRKRKSFAKPGETESVFKWSAVSPPKRNMLPL